MGEVIKKQDELRKFLTRAEYELENLQSRVYEDIVNVISSDDNAWIIANRTGLEILE